jgi:iron complex outermembrane receptor protein
LILRGIRPNAAGKRARGPQSDKFVARRRGYANQAQTFMTRGLPLNGDDISYHGLYGILPRQIISTDALERVEVFKGRNAFINGVPPGGSGIGGDGRVGEHLDIGQRLEDNRFGARINLSQREGTTGIDEETQRSKLFALGLDYRGDALRVSSDFVYQKQRINGGFLSQGDPRVAKLSATVDF